jgi:hypothetical protein
MTDVLVRLERLDGSAQITRLTPSAPSFVVIALARRVMCRIRVWQPAWAWRIPPYAIGSIAMFWVIQRIAAF